MSMKFPLFSIDIPPQTQPDKESKKEDNLPKVRGTYQFDYELGKHSFFKTGGKADVLFTPANVDDLVFFLKNKQKDLPIAVIGNMSNVLISDEGIRGVVISLKNLQRIDFEENTVRVDAGVDLGVFIQTCADRGVSCCEMLSVIPGTIGGALSMNAGTDLFEIKDVVVSIDVVDMVTGLTSQTSSRTMQYRNGNIPKNKIITSCLLKTKPSNKEQLINVISAIREKRKKTQPIGYPTCGSVFKNPGGTASNKKKAWQLIQESGCKQMRVRGASISPIHSNFIVNNGNATSADILTLINDIKMRVFDRTGIMLEEEIKVIGEAL